MFKLVTHLVVGCGLSVASVLARLHGKNAVANIIFDKYKTSLIDHLPYLNQSVLANYYSNEYVHVFNLAGVYELGDNFFSGLDFSNFRGIDNQGALMRIVETRVSWLFRRGRIQESADMLKQLPFRWQNGLLDYYQAHSIIALNGNIEHAISLLEKTAGQNTRLWQPHQNMAARNPEEYTPTTLDLMSGSDGLIYDAANYVGQRVIDAGCGHLAADVFGIAFAAQRRLRERMPDVSDELSALLAKWRIDIATLRIAPPEWTTQIGHLGMLDILLKMRMQGMWEGPLICLARPKSIANRPLLDLFNQFARVVVERETVSQEVFDELISLQRWCGLSFNAWEWPDGSVATWQEAGAFAMQKSNSEERLCSLRVACDDSFNDPTSPISVAPDLSVVLDLSPDQWYVCLHIRDGGYYAEGKENAGQTHRNSNFSDYEAAIQFICARGGKVVRMGSLDADPLPAIPGLIDYARSPHKSPHMDLQLIRNCRIFIGTTSGLTNVAVSFGIPCALVNCITIDAQLWNNRVRFALKPIRSLAGTLLSQKDLTTAPNRWSLYRFETLSQAGLSPITNTSDEILETVREVLEMPEQLENPILETWRKHLAVPYFYGGALPSLYFLEKYSASFLRGEA
ncbi:MAG: TIGR04372 family glycosyltransferase [Cytophaga sp.]|nr:TIGR04372 family glycosyltransferase [Undibacterium sp.]